ncbi:MAG: isochorismatase family cysteine hydrolase [Candidatus Diapherotrites archaeon]|nr:isochorismatase family cysteine hydrolase [Candidatus Diapherotrites archaeon]
MEVLLVIDMQEGFRYLDSERILERVGKILQKISPNYYFSRFKDKKNSTIEKHTLWKKFQDQKAWPIMSEIRHFSNKNNTFDHYTYTVLTPYLKKAFTKRHVKTVYLAGIYTDVCVIKTAMDLIDEGIQVKIIQDACASLHGEINHKQAIDSLKHIIGRDNVIKSNMIRKT